MNKRDNLHLLSFISIFFHSVTTFYVPMKIIASRTLHCMMHHLPISSQGLNF